MKLFDELSFQMDCIQMDIDAHGNSLESDIKYRKGGITTEIEFSNGYVTVRFRVARTDVTITIDTDHESKCFEYDGGRVYREYVTKGFHMHSKDLKNSVISAIETLKGLHSDTANLKKEFDEFFS
jgi:hypothetical protein